MKSNPPIRPPLIEDLLSGDADLATLARLHFPAARKPPLSRLALWYEEPETAALINTLLLLLSDRAELIAAHARAVAARQMLRLAQDDASPDVARKACLDLLKLSSPRAGSLNTARNTADDPPGSIEEAWQRVMSAPPAEPAHDADA